MNADVNAIEYFVILLIEFLFGIGYNALVAYLHKHELMHVSWSVVIGVAVTMLIPLGLWSGDTIPFWKWDVLLAGCFVASGLPMIVGSNLRTVSQKDNKKRRPWPNAAAQVRDDAVMELSAMANEIAMKAKAQELTAGDLPEYVHRLHTLVGMLKSV